MRTISEHPLSVCKLAISKACPRATSSVLVSSVTISCSSDGGELGIDNRGSYLSKIFEMIRSVGTWFIPPPEIEKAPGDHRQALS